MPALTRSEINADANSAIAPMIVNIALPPLETGFHDAKNARSRYRQLIRGYLDVRAYADGGARVVEQTVTQAAYRMSDPADLINLALEHLIQQRFELPAFQTLDRVVSHLRYRVHQDLYARMTASLSTAEKARLDALVHVHAGRSEFNRICAFCNGRRATRGCWATASVVRCL